MAILLVAGIVVVAKPLTAAAAGRPHGHHHGRFRAHDTVTAGHRPLTVPQVTSGDAHSPNWSGYVAYADGASEGFTEVSADWTEAAVNCPKKGAWTLFWVGFDGWPAGQPTYDRSVEQGGTSARCVDGKAHYSAFYEMWPTQAVTPVFDVQPGDHITANVAYADNQFFITVTDTTSQPVQTFTKTETCGANLACNRSSAEWIAESPSHFGTNRWFPLANYGRIDFTNATVTDSQGVSGPIADSPQWSDLGIERTAGVRQTLTATVTALENSDGSSSFADIWKRR